MQPYRWIGPAVITALSWNPLGAAPPEGQSDLASELAQLRQTVTNQQQQIQQLRGDKDARWLDERRAEEVKALVREVLADADTRASLLAGGPVAGYSGGFFISAEDGSFQLKINGEEQIRYIYNDTDAPNADDTLGGFQIRRARLAFSGHLLDPKLTYRLRLAYDRANGNLQFDDAWFAYELAKGWKIQVGQFKPQFVRDEIVGGFAQLAVERAYVTDYFSVDYAQGAELTYTGDKFRFAASVHDGSYSNNTDFNADRTNIGFSGRAELLLAGKDWRQFNDYTTQTSDDLGILLGAGVGYELGDGVNGAETPDILKIGLDASVEVSNINFLVAFYYQTFDDNGNSSLPSNLDDAKQLSFIVQGGAYVIPNELELFARYEWIDWDGVYYRNNGSGTQGGTGNIGAAFDNETSFLTVGGNYYFHRNKHAAKLTIDVVYALDTVPVANTGAGILASADDGQIALRTQLQFKF